MMLQVTGAAQALALKDQLADAGLILHYDYTWCYHPLIEDYMDPDNNWPPRVEFNFTDKKWETYFTLKWSNYQII